MKVIFINLMLFFVLSELVLQLFPHFVPQSNYHKLYRAQKKSDWRLKGYLKQNYYGGCYHTLIETDAFGLRHTGPLKEELIPIVGDSFVLGLEVDNRDHFIHLLSKEAPSSFVNLGQGGAGPNDYPGHLEDFLNTILPGEMKGKGRVKEALVLFFLGNDFENGVNKSRHALKRELMTNQKDKDPRRLIPKSWRVIKTLYAFEIFYRRFVLTALEGDSNSQIITTADYYQTLKSSSYWPKISSALQKSFSKMKELQGRYTVRIKVGAIPGVNEFSELPPRARVMEQLALIKEYSSGFGLEYLPLAEALLARADREKLSFPWLSFSCDGHYSPKGHRWMAQELKNLL